MWYWLRKFLFWILKKGFKPLVGKGVGRRLPLVAKAFLFFYHYLSPGAILTEVQAGGVNLNLYVDSKSSFARALLIKGFYERGTTRLFKDLVKEGMVILDIGAHVGYYCLIAARLVGRKGMVFAFEPEPDNFGFLVKNIEVNGFSNIVPVRKAVSNITGRGRLFLSHYDPGWHSMYQRNEKGSKSIEVDTVTLDEFIQNINCPVDLIKIDVEGLEMRVLEGMPGIIRRNPTLKIITEFSPDQLQRSSSSPLGFLRKLMDCGFKLYLIDEEREATRFANVDTIMAACQGEETVNLYCDRQSEKSGYFEGK